MRGLRTIDIGNGRETTETDTMIVSLDQQGKHESIVQLRPDVVLHLEMTIGGHEMKAGHSALAQIFVETLNDTIMIVTTPGEGIRVHLPDTQASIHASTCKRLCFMNLCCSLAAPRRSDSPPPRPLLRGNSPGPSTYPTSRNYSPSPVRNITELDSPRTTSSHRSVLRGKEHHGRSDHGTPSRTSSPTRSRRERSRSQGSTKAKDESQDVTRSISHPPRSPLEKQPDTLPPLRDPSPPGAASSKSPLHARPSSPTIVQEEVHLEQQIPMEQREEELPSWLNTSRDKGKSKEEPETTEDIEMRAEIPHSPASNPRELEQVPRRRSRSPPTGPRHYLNIPTGPAFAQHISPVNSNESVQSPQLNSLATWTQTRMDVDPSPKAEASQSQVTHPPYEPKPYPAKQFEPEVCTLCIFIRLSITDALTQIARLETLCQATMADYAQSGHEVRRARHELEMATIDFRAAELRREIADAQVEQARLGTLGIDARSERISSPVPASA